jgi:hypothetical protein
VSPRDRREQVKEIRLMVGSNSLTSVLVVLAATGLALGQPATPASAIPANAVGRTLTITETGRNTKCKVLQVWRQPDGMQAMLVESTETGEKISVVEVLQPPTEPGNGPPLSTRIFHWGRGVTTPPPGVPAPPMEASQASTKNVSKGDSTQASVQPAPQKSSTATATGSPAVKNVPDTNQPAPQKSSTTTAWGTPAVKNVIPANPDTKSSRPDTKEVPKQVAQTSAAPVSSPVISSPATASPKPTPTPSQGPIIVTGSTTSEAVPTPASPSPSVVSVSPSAQTSSAQTDTPLPVIEKGTVPQSVSNPTPPPAPVPAPVAKQQVTVPAPVAKQPEPVEKPVSPPPAKPIPSVVVKVEATPDTKAKDAPAPVRSNWRQSWGNTQTASATTDVKPKSSTNSTQSVMTKPTPAVQPDPLADPERYSKVVIQEKMDKKVEQVKVEEVSPTVKFIPVPVAQQAASSPVSQASVTGTTVDSAPLPKSIVIVQQGQPAPVAVQPVREDVPLGMRSVVSAHIAAAEGGRDSHGIPIEDNGTNAFAEATPPAGGPPVPAPVVAANAFVPPMPPSAPWQGAPQPMASGTPLPAMPPQQAVIQARAMVPGYGGERADVQQWMNVLKDSLYPSQRENATDELASLEWKAHPLVVQALVKAACEDPAKTVRVASIHGLVRMQATCMPVVRALEGLSTDSDASVRVEAEQALATLAPTLQHGNGSVLPLK